MKKSTNDRFKNKLVKGNIVTFASPGSAKSTLGKKYLVLNIFGNDLELKDMVTNKRGMIVSSHNVVKIR